MAACRRASRRARWPVRKATVSLLGSRGSPGSRAGSRSRGSRAVAPSLEPRPLAEPAPVTIYHPKRWNKDGNEIAGNVHELRPKTPDSEKITINLGYVDLGRIDLLVREGFYSNRTDLIRTAIRNQLERHADAAKRSAEREGLDLGLRHYGRAELEAARDAGLRLDIRVLGLASIAQDVTPELARAAIGSVVVLGALHASPAVKAALADRIR